MRHGICLPPRVWIALERAPPGDAAELADTILRAEGLDPAHCLELRSDVLSLIEQFFEVDVPDELRRELAPLLMHSHESGFRVARVSQVDALAGDFVMEFRFEGGRLDLVKMGDRYRLAGPIDQLRALRLLGPLNLEEIAAAMTRFRAAHVAA